MAASDYSPLGNAALRSSVALDASSIDWARQSYAFTEISADVHPTSVGTEAESTLSAMQAKVMRSAKGLPLQQHSAADEIQAAPLSEPAGSQRQKIRFFASPGTVRAARPQRLTKARTPAEELAPSSPTIAAHHSARQPDSRLSANGSLPPCAATVPALMTHSEQHSSSKALPEAPAGDVQGTAVGLNTARRGNTAGKAQDDDVSLWGSSTFDELNAGSGSDDSAAADQSTADDKTAAASGKAVDRTVAQQAQQAASDQQVRVDQRTPGSGDGARTPKRSFYAMLTGQGRSRVSPRPQAAATTLSPSPDPPLSPHRPLSPDQQPASAMAGAPSAHSPGAAEAPIIDSEVSCSSEQSSFRKGGAQQGAESAQEEHSAGYEAIPDAEALTGSDSSSCASQDVSPPRPAVQHQRTSPLQHSPVPPLRLSALSNQLEQQRAPGSTKESSSPSWQVEGPPVAAAAVQQPQVQVQPVVDKRDARTAQGVRAKSKQQHPTPVPVALQRHDMEAASMRQLIQQLSDSPTKPASTPPSLHPSTSPRQQYSAVRDTLMRGNPLYGRHRSPIARTPDSMLGSHTASNQVHAASASATMKSVTGRPVCNPLFETQDTQSRHEGKAIDFEDYSYAGSFSPASALSSLSSPSLSQLDLRRADSGDSPSPLERPSTQSATGTGVHDMATQAAVQDEKKHRQGVMGKLRSWRGKQGNRKENGAETGQHGRKGRRMSKLLSCFATPPLTTEHRGVV